MRSLTKSPIVLFLFHRRQALLSKMARRIAKRREHWKEGNESSWNQFVRPMETAEYKNLSSESSGDWFGYKVPSFSFYSPQRAVIAAALGVIAAIQTGMIARATVELQNGMCQ